jgi:hypothetical protein
LAEQNGIGQTLERVFAGTPLEAVLGNMKGRAATAKK